MEDKLFTFLMGQVEDVELAQELEEVSSEDNTAQLSAAQKINQALSTLPIDLQNLFADRLVAHMANPDALQTQAIALTSLAASAAQEVSSQQFAIPSGGDSKVAAAVLEAFLIHRQFEANQQQQQEHCTAFSM